jgi:hypothetical protein
LSASPDLALWAPLMAILAPTKGLLKAKKAVLKAMMDAAGEAVTQLEAELKQLLDGRGDMDLYRVMKVVEKAVAKDCEERGCLRLSSVAAFSEEWKGKRSFRWSWTD